MPSPIRLELGDRWAFEGLLLTFERELGGDLLQFRIERSGAPLRRGPSSPNWKPGSVPTQT